MRCEWDVFEHAKHVTNCKPYRENKRLIIESIESSFQLTLENGIYWRFAHFFPCKDGYVQYVCDGSENADLYES